MMTIIFDSLKMNEAWVNAPSLENDLINFFKNNDASDDFWKQVS